MSIIYDFEAIGIDAGKAPEPRPAEGLGTDAAPQQIYCHCKAQLGSPNICRCFRVRGGVHCLAW